MILPEIGGSARDMQLYQKRPVQPDMHVPGMLKGSSRGTGSQEYIKHYGESSN
jgi:hypothetical protein